VRFVSEVLLTQNLAFVSTDRAVYGIELSSHYAVWSYPLSGRIFTVTEWNPLHRRRITSLLHRLWEEQADRRTANELAMSYISDAPPLSQMDTSIRAQCKFSALTNSLPHHGTSFNPLVDGSIPSRPTIFHSV
jgi:hypothetical protein